MSQGSLPNSECILDSQGHVVSPGDAMWLEKPNSKTLAIYTGNQEVIIWDWRTDYQVKKQKLDMTQPLNKLVVYSEGAFPVFPSWERVERAQSRVGAAFTEGDGGRFDFLFWVFSGVAGRQATKKDF